MVPSSTPHLQRKVITFGSGGRPDLDTEDPASMELLDGLATDTAALQEVRRQLEDLPVGRSPRSRCSVEPRPARHATGPQQQSEPMDPNLWGGLPADVKMSIILEGADTKRLLDARTLGRYARAFVDRRAQAMVPYPDEILFRLVNGSSFPDVFAKGNFTKEAIAKHENATISWEQYRKTAEGKSAQALIMRIYETEALRTTSPATPALEAEQVVFRPVVTGKWTPQIDDAWILGHIHHRHQILIVCDPTRRSNFFDEKAKRLTATGREILLALDSGYQCLANTGTIGGVSGGLLLQPPDRIVPNHLLPTTLHPVATQRLLGAFPRADAGTPLMVGAQPFGPKVAQEITKRYAQQIHDREEEPGRPAAAVQAAGCGAAGLRRAPRTMSEPAHPGLTHHPVRRPAGPSRRAAHARGCCSVPPEVRSEGQEEDRRRGGTAEVRRGDEQALRTCQGAHRRPVSVSRAVVS